MVGGHSWSNVHSCIPDEKIQVNPKFGQGQKYWSDPDVLTLFFLPYA